MTSPSPEFSFLNMNFSAVPSRRTCIPLILKVRIIPQPNMSTIIGIPQTKPSILLIISLNPDIYTLPFFKICIKIILLFSHKVNINKINTYFCSLPCLKNTLLTEIFAEQFLLIIIFCRNSNFRAFLRLLFSFSLRLF